MTSAGGSLLAAALAVAAVLLATHPGPVRRLRVRVSGTGQPVPVPVPSESRPRVRRRRRGNDPDGAERLAAAVAAVAAELRAGRAPHAAWRSVLRVVPDADGVPRPADVLVALDLAPPRDGGPDPAARVAGVLAATRLAADLGAPLADVLDGCARSLAADAEAEAAVRAALAGPAQTTRLLTWLPLLAAGLGTVLGADVSGVLLDGRAGTGAGLLGLALTLVGRRWVDRLVTAARRSGDEPVPER